MLQVKIEDVFGAGNRWRKDLTEMKKTICRDVGGVHTGIYVGKEPRAVHVRSVQFKWNTASIFKKMIVISNCRKNICRFHSMWNVVWSVEFLADLKGSLHPWSFMVWGRDWAKSSSSHPSELPRKKCDLRNAFLYWVMFQLALNM